MTDCEREAMGVWEWGTFLDRTKFFGNAKLWFKSKLLINTLQFLISTATKITSSYHILDILLHSCLLLYHNPYKLSLTFLILLLLFFYDRMSILQKSTKSNRLKYTFYRLYSTCFVETMQSLL